MNNQTNRTNNLPSRATLRARCSGTVRFQIGRETGGHAELADVGLGGLSLTSKTELKVGSHVLVELHDPRGDGSAELKGKVVWQRRTDAGYRMGVKVFEDDVTARFALSDCLHAALKDQSGLTALRGRQGVLVDLAIASKDLEDRPSVWQRLRPTAPMTGVNIATASF